MGYNNNQDGKICPQCRSGIDAKGVYLLFFYLYNKHMTKSAYTKQNKEQKAKMSLLWLKAPENKIHNRKDSMIVGSRQGFRSRNMRAWTKSMNRERTNGKWLKVSFHSQSLPPMTIPPASSHLLNCHRTVPPPRDWLFKCMRLCGAFIIQTTIGSKQPLPGWI